MPPVTPGCRAVDLFLAFVYPLDACAAVMTDLAISAPNNAPPRANVQAGERAPLTATASFSDNTAGDVMASVTWTPSDPKIATVDASGKITGASPGAVTITAYLEEGLTHFRALDEAGHIAWTPCNLGMVALRRGDWDAAADALAECLTLRAEQGNVAEITACCGATTGLCRVRPRGGG